MMHRVAILAILFGALCSSPATADLVLEHQVTGLQTNCYLLYDSESKEAALFDVGGPVDSLLKIIGERDLDLCYLIFTHGHPDHYAGFHAVRENYPEAAVCMHRADYVNLPHLDEWAREFFGEEDMAESMEDPEFRKMIEFDESTFPEPDIFVVDGRRFGLGKFEMTAYHSPGHSAGSVCFGVDGLLFSGDVLFKGRAGRVDLLGGSREDQIQSIRRLYQLLPDGTKVLPGHGPATTIGAERSGNVDISENDVNI